MMKNIKALVAKFYNKKGLTDLGSTTVIWTAWLAANIGAIYWLKYGL